MRERGEENGKRNFQGCRAPKRKEVPLDEKKLKGNLVAKQGRA